jgi:hypothetical protein
LEVGKKTKAGKSAPENYQNRPNESKIAGKVKKEPRENRQNSTTFTFKMPPETPHSNLKVGARREYLRS